MLVSAGFSDHPPDFTFERKPGLPYWTASVMMRGGAIVRAGGADLPQVAGCVLLIAPDTPYQTRSDGRGKDWVAPWFIFQPTAAQRPFMQWPEHARGVRQLVLAPGGADFEQVATAWTEAQWTLRHKPAPLNQVWAELAFTRGLLHASARALRQDPQRRTPHDPRMDAVVEYMHRHPGERLNVAALAKRAHLSASHLAHLFREQTGQTPMRYLEEVRLHRAQELLLGTNKSVGAIAGEVGFENPYHFSTRFRRRFGQSPRHFRNHPKG